MTRYLWFWLDAVLQLNRVFASMSLFDKLVEKLDGGFDGLTSAHIQASLPVFRELSPALADLLEKADINKDGVINRSEWDLYFSFPYYKEMEAEFIRVVDAMDPASLAHALGHQESETLPSGWVKVPSQTRPGQFTYINQVLGKKVRTLEELHILIGDLPAGERECPPGWRKAPSQSRPGQFVWIQSKLAIKVKTVDEAWVIHEKSQHSSSTSPGSPPVASPPSLGPQPQRNILCFGDSNTWGFRGSPPGQKPYGKTLESLLIAEGYPVEVTTCGCCGFTAKRLWEEKDQADVPGSGGQPGLAHLLEKKQFNLVIIMLGTNGLNMGQDPTEIMEYTEKLHQFCHARKIKTMAVAGIMPNPTQWGTRLISKHHNMADLLKNFEALDDWDGDDCVAFADPEELVPRSAKSYHDADEIHFNQAGLDHLARQMLQQVKGALNKTFSQ